MSLLDDQVQQKLSHFPSGVRSLTSDQTDHCVTPGVKQTVTPVFDGFFMVLLLDV